MTARAGVGVPSSARAESPAEGLAMDWMRLAGSAGWARSAVAWVESREPALTVVGAACAFVTAFATTWIAIQ